METNSLNCHLVVQNKNGGKPYPIAFDENGSLYYGVNSSGNILRINFPFHVMDEITKLYPKEQLLEELVKSNTLPSDIDVNNSKLLIAYKQNFKDRFIEVLPKEVLEIDIEVEISKFNTEEKNQLKQYLQSLSSQAYIAPATKIFFQELKDEPRNKTLINDIPYLEQRVIKEQIHKVLESKIINFQEKKEELNARTLSKAENF